MARLLTIAALTTRVESGTRMAEQVAAATSQLTVLNARLDEAVTRSIELSARDFRAEEFASVESNLLDVSTQLGALREALIELPDAGARQSGAPDDGGSAQASGSAQ